MKNRVRIAWCISVLTICSITKLFGYHSLQFMVRGSLSSVVADAKKEQKPIMLYIHANNCSSSRTFTRQIIANAEFAKWVAKNFICVEADITTLDGNNIAKKFKTTSLPSIIMLSYDQQLEYKVELKLDSVFVYSQFRSFITANNLKIQIEILHSTNGISYKEASKAIAKSYAKRDYKKYAHASAELMAHELTFNIGRLGWLNKAYVVEYKKLERG